jgi:hypothetical protein
MDVTIVLPERVYCEWFQAGGGVIGDGNGSASPTVADVHCHVIPYVTLIGRGSLASCAPPSLTLLDSLHWPAATTHVLATLSLQPSLHGIHPASASLAIWL